jgi:hypothetical protein
MEPSFRCRVTKLTVVGIDDSLTNAEDIMDVNLGGR